MTEYEVKQLIQKETGGSGSLGCLIMIAMIGLPIGLIHREVKHETGTVIEKSVDLGIFVDGWYLAVKKQDGELVAVNAYSQWNKIEKGSQIKIKRQMHFFIQGSPWVIDN